MQSEQQTVIIWAVALGITAAAMLWLVLAMHAANQNYQLNKQRDTQVETWANERTRNDLATQRQYELTRQLLKP